MSWNSTLAEALRKRGTSLAEYLRSRPGVGYVALAAELDENILPVTIARQQLGDAFKLGGEAFRTAAQDALLRHIRESLSQGWDRLRPEDPEDTDRDIVSLVPWSIWSQQVGAVDESADQRTQAVYAELRKHAAVGWLPETTADPILVAAFAAGWDR